MAIWTSRYSNKELQNDNYYTVGITLGKPKFKLGFMESEHCYILAPNKSMWGKSREEFRRLYRGKLDQIGEEKIRKLLRGLQNRSCGKDVVLLCYEDVRDPDQHCHRTTLGEWINEKFGIDVKELQDPSPVKYKNRETAERIKREQQERTQEQYRQMNLFEFI